MHRRLFSQLLALGAGMFSFGAVNGANQAGGAEQNDQKKKNAKPSSPAVEAATVSDFIQLAKAKMPKATFEYVTTGSEDEVTLRDNVAAFRRMRVLPPLLHGVGEADLSTTVLGQKIKLPVLLAPVAALRMYHPEGALAAARAAAAAGTIFVPSTSAMNSVEEIAAAADGPRWFQLYAPSDRRVARQLVQRAERAGYSAIVVTVDLGERKDADLRNRFRVPREMLLKHLRDVGHTQFDDNTTYEELLAFNEQAWELSMSWDFFQWLRTQTKLPILVKGVLSPAAARKAMSLSLDGIVVSNHGGRRLDGMPATIDVLGDVSSEIRGRIEVLMDGGVRRVADVLKALALGAKAVLVGRPLAWSLAAGGEAGVKRMLDILRDEMTNAMIATGCPTVDKIDSSLIMPRGNHA